MTEKDVEQRLDEDSLVHRALKEMRSRKWFPPVMYVDDRDATGRTFGDAIIAAVREIRSLRSERWKLEKKAEAIGEDIDRVREELTVLLEAIPRRGEVA